LEIDVALIPYQATKWQNKVCVVVDVIRASSAIVTLLEVGVPRIIPIRSLAEARNLARAENWVLAGERDGVAPPDFDFSNSPTQLVQADLAGKVVVLATSNGTVVLDSLKDFPRVFVGSFLNARACCRAAVEEALRLEMGVGIVCAGKYGEFVLDDAVCSGYLVGEASQYLQSIGGKTVLSDAALAAQQLYQSYPSILDAFLLSDSGKTVIDIGDGEDNLFCSQIDTSQKTPVLVPGSLPYLETWVAAEEIQ
jgi:2-phosphosulfolactate phosphatase